VNNSSGKSVLYLRITVILSGGEAAVEGSAVARTIERVPHLREAKVGLQDSDAAKNVLTRHATASKKKEVKRFAHWTKQRCDCYREADFAL